MGDVVDTVGRDVNYSVKIAVLFCFIFLAYRSSNKKVKSGYGFILGTLLFETFLKTSHVTHFPDYWPISYAVTINKKMAPLFGYFFYKNCNKTVVFNMF